MRLDTLCERTWYEFKVIALNAAGSSPASTASQPVQTGSSPTSSASRTVHEAGLNAVAIATELHMKSPRCTGFENLMIEREVLESLLALMARALRKALPDEGISIGSHAFRTLGSSRGTRTVSGSS